MHSTIRTLGVPAINDVGRLANQFFLRASALGLARKSGRELVMPEWKYEKYFTYKVEGDNTIAGVNDLSEISFHCCMEFFEKRLNGTTQHIGVGGYLQSEKYFDHCRDEVKKMFTFSDEFYSVQESKYKEIFKKPVIGIHIRRGDYVGNENYHNLPINYYLGALEEFFPEWELTYNILVFSDDIKWCKSHLETDNVYFSEENSDIEDLCILSMCNHFILSNSSYSWWGAWLGETEDSITVRPIQMFEGSLKKTHNTKDFWPERWLKYDYEGKKLDLSYVTFTIPVHHDHSDRLINLGRVITYLRDNFDTEIIVGEQGSEQYGGLGYFPPIQYIHFNKMYDFHRTKMLNEMMGMSKQSVIVNYDADVIIPLIQLILACRMAYNGVCMVFPYDGRFARIPKEKHHMPLSSFDPNRMLGARSCDPISVGGCVVVNRWMYENCGGENENFVSYGPEDTERVERVEKLGFKIGRIKGPLYHYDHWVGPNSNGDNPHFANNYKELAKIRKMNERELTEYIESWNFFK